MYEILLRLSKTFLQLAGEVLLTICEMHTERTRRKLQLQLAKPCSSRTGQEAAAFRGPRPGQMDTSHHKTESHFAQNVSTANSWEREMSGQEAKVIAANNNSNCSAVTIFRLFRLWKDALSFGHFWVQCTPNNGQQKSSSSSSGVFIAQALAF